MTRRQFLAGSLALAACMGGTRASQIGTANVATMNQAEARFVLDHGFTLVALESMPFNREPHGPLPSVVEILDRMAGVVAETRARGAVLLWYPTNWNGPQQRQAPDTWQFDQVEAVMDRLGAANIWCCPVSEPLNDPKARRWITESFRRWDGVRVVNGEGGRGTLFAAADIVDYHYCDYPLLLNGVTRIGGHRLHNTDCGPILASRLTEQQVKEVTRVARARARTLLLYDTFNAPALNRQVVEWMAESLEPGPDSGRSRTRSSGRGTGGRRSSVLSPKFVEQSSDWTRSPSGEENAHASHWSTDFAGEAVR